MSELANKGGDVVRSTPFTQWPIFDEREERNLQDVLQSGKWWRFAFGQGVELTEPEEGDRSQVALFQEEFSCHHDCKYGIAAANGTGTLEMGIRDLDFDTAFGKQFNQARFLGLNMSRQIPNWLYDVDALKTENGYTAAGNHSATEIQALVLSKQMDRMKKIIGKRKKAAEYLTRRLSKIEGVITPLGNDKNVTTSYHLYQLQIEPDKVGGDYRFLKVNLMREELHRFPILHPCINLVSWTNWVTIPKPKTHIRFMVSHGHICGTILTKVFLLNWKGCLKRLRNCTNSWEKKTTTIHSRMIPWHIYTL